MHPVLGIINGKGMLRWSLSKDFDKVRIDYDIIFIEHERPTIKNVKKCKEK